MIKNSKAKKITVLTLILLLVIFLGPYRLPRLSASVSNTFFSDETGTALTTFEIGEDLYVTTQDSDEDKDITIKDTIEVQISTSNTDQETLTLTETANSSGIFRNIDPLTSSEANVVKNNNNLELAHNDTATVSYSDSDTIDNKVLTPVVVNEGAHIDDGDNSNDPSLYKSSADVELCDPAIAESWGFCSCYNKREYSDDVLLATHDLNQWDPNDPTNGGYIPTDRTKWDIYDRGQSFIDEGFSSIKKSLNSDILSNINDNDGLVGVPPIKKDLPASAKDFFPAEEIGLDGYEYNSAIAETANDIGSQKINAGGFQCSGWNIHEFVFETDTSPVDISNINFVWNGYFGKQDEAQTSEKPGQTYNHNDAYVLVLNLETNKWETLDEAIGELTPANTALYTAYDNSNNGTLAPKNVEDYGPQEFKSSNPIESDLADDINLTGSVTSNFSNYLDTNGNLSIAVVEYEFRQVVANQTEMTLYTDFVAAEVTLADSSSDSLVAQAPDDIPIMIDEGTCSISGNVYTDLDRDGTKDTSELGLGNVKVELYIDEDKLKETNTNSSGNFSIADLNCDDTYSLLEIDPTGYASSTPNEFKDFEVTAGQITTFVFGDYLKDVVIPPPVVTPTTLPTTGAHNDPYPFVIVIFGLPLLAAIYGVWSYRKR